MSFLDNSGLQYLWSKIRGIIGSGTLNTTNKTIIPAINELNNGLASIRAFNNPKVIRANEDLNNYAGVDKAGVYYVNGTTVTISNAPTNYCALYVMSSGSPTFQFAFNKNAFYFRAYTGSPATWGEWHSVSFT